MARWHAVNWTRYHSLLHTLAGMGHEIHVLQPPPLNSMETNYQEIEARTHERVTVHDVFIPDFLWRRRFFLDKLVKKAVYCMAATRVVRSMIANGSYDVLLLYNIPQWPFSAIRGPLIVFDYADDYIDMLGRELGPLRNKAVLTFAKAVLTKMMRRARLVLSVSNELARSGPVPMKVLPNGVESAMLNETPRTVPRDIKNEGRPVVGFVGSFEYFIDFDAILEAAQLCPDVHFLLVGTGRDFENIKKKIIEKKLSNIELTGGVAHNEVFGYIGAMDICLNIFKPLPVSHRACPIKLFEYWSQKKPVISTRLSELAHVDGGWLYYADTAAELAATIRLVLMSPDVAEERALKAYAEVKQRYTWEGIAQSFVNHVAVA